MEYIATFFTHSAAIKYQRFLKSLGISVDLMPVPRRISSNCGIAARFSYKEDISQIIGEDIEQIYTVQGREYNIIYKTGEE